MSGAQQNDLSLEQLYLTDVSSGVYYRFKYRARNVHGDGEASESFTILAATIPNTPQPPTVSFDTQGDYVISFIEPNTGGAGVKIFEYAIEVKSKNESYITPESCTSSPEILLTK